MDLDKNRSWYMVKKHNDILYLGVFIFVVGIILSVYSIFSYTELRSLEKKIDFELIDDNANLSYEDKYAQYLSIAEFLNKKIDKNKNLPIKTSSCSYVDYAKHNAVELYNLTTRRMKQNVAHTNVATTNVRTLYNSLNDYNTCSNVKEYKDDLQLILTDVEKNEKTQTYSDERMQKFINGYYDKKTIQEVSVDDLQIDSLGNDDLEKQLEELQLENYIE
ncbi:MAG: hypothetical protein E7Z87_05100 [Cyanobacteria bacterium SIG26]|nr:hypothetical protein [Cyanobacteria bacterium SIG26]